MKKFVFREAKLLALRKQEVAIAELAVAAAAKNEHDAKRAVESEERALEELSSTILAAGRHNVTHISRTAMGIRYRLEAAQSRQTEATAQVVTSMNDLVKRKLAVEPLSELEASRRRAHADDCRKREQIEIDSLFSRKRLATEQRPDV